MAAGAKKLYRLKVRFGWGTWIRTKIDGVRVRHVMPKNFASSRAGQSQKPDALAIVAKRVCEACQTAESSESDRTRSKHPFFEPKPENIIFTVWRRLLLPAQEPPCATTALK